MPASYQGAVLVLGLAGCNFVIGGVQVDSFGDSIELGDSMELGDPDLSGDVELGTTADLGQSPDLTPAAGLLTGTISRPTANAVVNLTTEGTSDWATWGHTDQSSFDHKSLVTSLIPNYTGLGNTQAVQFTTYHIGFSWTDGMPTVADTNSTTGVYKNGDGEGFSITVPADTATRTLRLYSGGQSPSTTKVVAHLSDGSAADYTASTMFGSGDTGAQYERMVTLTYRAGSSGQTLRVDWVQVGALGFVHLHAATLQPSR